MSRLIIAIIKIYQMTVSRFTSRTCRFYPSCSHYMIQAIQTTSCLQGIWLGIKRLSKCHPFHPGGIDPVRRVS